MNDLLREWLIHQLGLNVNSLHPKDLCSMFQNGLFIGKLLQNYNIVNTKDLSLLVDEEDEMIIKSNFQYLKVWLNTINISLDDNTIDGIISKKRSVVFGFLYRLCFLLECPNNLNLTEHAKKIYNSFGSFDFLSTSSTPKPHIINLPYNEQDPGQKCHTNNILQHNEKLNKNSSICYDNINEFECSLTVKLDNWTARGDQSCIRFLSDLKAWKQHSRTYGFWRKENMNTYLQDNLDVAISRNQEVLRNKSVSNKINIMSEWEEKMLDKVNNARFIIKQRNTILAENEIQWSNENDIAHGKYDIISEEMKLNLKEELTKINNQKKKIEIRKVMKSIVQNVIDLSVRGGYYSKKYSGIIPKHLWDDWNEMFMKGRPMLTILDYTLGLLLDNKHLIENNPHSDEELLTQHILNRRDIMQYLECVKNWSEKELGVKTNYPPGGSRDLGFLVYDVLTLHYTLPSSLVKIDNTLYGSVMGVLNVEIKEESKHEIFNALIQRNILPVLPEMALQYCLYAYYQESDNDELLKQLEAGNSYIASLNRYVKEKSIEENVSDHARIVLLNEIGHSKQTQTPDKFDKYYKSERSECGKNAFINIYKSKPIPKHNLVDCVLCYIKENNMLEGWVLLGFPQEELMILEERLNQKHNPPFGSYSYMENKSLTTMIPFNGPDLGDVGRYSSFLTCYVEILSYDNVFGAKWDDMHTYYKAHGLLTLLQSTNKNMHLDTHKIELICNVLTGKIVNWFDEINWVNCIHDRQKGETDILSSDSIDTDSYHSKRERLHGKSEFDFIDQISAMKSDLFMNALMGSNHEKMPKVSEIKSYMYNFQISSDFGVPLGNFWKLLETEFIENLENIFFCRRILIYEQEPYIATINKHLNDFLETSSMNKLELVKRLQSDLFNVPVDALEIPEVIRQSLLAVSDTRIILMHMTNQKIEKCRQFIENENIENWLDKQFTSLFMIYKSILQNEVDRTVNTLLFINSYMSKLHSQKLILSIIPKPIEVSSSKGTSEVKLVQTMTKTEEYAKKFNATTQTSISKIKSMFSVISEWLEELKEVKNSESLEQSSVYLKIWKFLVTKENWRSINQLKLISGRFQKDMKEMDNYFTQYRSDMNQRIDNRLHLELFEVERICNLFETAINEKLIVRHEIVIADDCFYLNPENILYPNIPPSQPFPLLEPNDLFEVTIDNLETITTQLISTCPGRCISLTILSSWLMSCTNYISQIEWLNSATPVLCSLFGSTINYIDWSDFVVHCMELTYPTIDELLDLKNKYRKLERERKNNLDLNHIEGTIYKEDFDSVLLWYQKNLATNPSIHYRFMKIKDLLFKTFSTDGKLDYVVMLLALCRDEHPVMGLIKAVSLVMDKNIMANQRDSYEIYENNFIQLPMEILFKTLFFCIRNYMSLDKSDIESVLSSILHVYNKKSNESTFSTLELFENNGLKSLSEIGFRFNQRSLSIIVNNLKQL